ncbi:MULTISPECIES: TadE family type IV pilus minor pilin [unclassified Micromonospora]|uniref:TadE family type IV pilus minor pilin n=1 Tax=unclassified Micromonospora TaxID=2617518 RepID=UPI0033C6C285
MGVSAEPGPFRDAASARAGAVWRRWRSWAACERGSFTAELAAGLPALMMLLVAGLTAVNAVGTRVACVDAAREAALAAARGEPGTPAGTRYAPDGAEVAVTVAGDRVTATVRAPVRTFGTRLPRLVVSGEAVAAVEPGAPGPVP